MQLLLLRHGIAQESGPRADDPDGSRALTDEGAARMRRGARGMVALGLQADVVISSPLVRCRQTGEIVARALGAPAREDPRLRPGTDLDHVDDLLLEHQGADSVLICGHQPDLSGLVSDLTGGGLAEFRRGSLAVLDVIALRPHGGRLRALYPPAALRALAAD